MEQKAEKKENEEQQYLDLLARVQREGFLRPDRTGVGTRSLFGVNLRFSLRNDRYPLFTGRRLSFRNIFYEWLWMVSGDTHTNSLSTRNIHIWDDNTTRKELDRQGRTSWEEGWLGKGYGYQWRHWNAQPGSPYVPSFFSSLSSSSSSSFATPPLPLAAAGQRGVFADNINSGAGGIDQIQGLIRGLRRDPFSRRHILTAWNPSDLSEMALPPCHCWLHFSVVDLDPAETTKKEEKEGKRKKLGLVCTMTQRSGDLVLGVPYNVASYALMTKAIAALVDMEPVELVVHIEDAHVYQDPTHIAAVEKLTTDPARRPRPFPTLCLVANVLPFPQKKDAKKDDESWRDPALFLFKDWELRGYDQIPDNFYIKMMT